MGIGRKIKEARLARNLTQEDLASALGITKSAVANYENEFSHPKEPVLYKLFSALQVDANYLFSDILEPAHTESSLSPAEQLHLQHYRSLSSYGKETIDCLLERTLHTEQAAAQSSAWQPAAALDSGTKLISFAAASEKANSEKAAPARKGPAQQGEAPLPLSAASHTPAAQTAVTRLYPYLHHVASAGVGAYMDDIPSETIEAPVLAGADFIIGVNGESMEPLYHNGELLYVARTDRLRVGEIGIFAKDGSYYIKEVGKDRLISINRAFPDIYPDSDNILTVGLVLGKVEIESDPE